MTALYVAAAVSALAVALAVAIAVMLAGDRLPARAHPHAADGLDVLRSRRSQDDLEGWR